MSSVNITQFVVLIKGVATKFFSSSRGLRKSFPLSPYLFILVVEGLSRIIKEVVGQNEFQGPLVGNFLSLSHLLFVDDVLLFCYGNERNLKKLLESLDLFCDDTCMEVDYNNSACYCLI